MAVDGLLKGGYVLDVPLKLLTRPTGLRSVGKASHASLALRHCLLSRRL